MNNVELDRAFDEAEQRLEKLKQSCAPPGSREELDALYERLKSLKASRASAPAKLNGQRCRPRYYQDLKEILEVYNKIVMPLRIEQEKRRLRTIKSLTAWQLRRNPNV